MSTSGLPLMVDLVELRERTRHLEPVALSAYLALLDHQWAHGTLPSEDRDLAAVCHLTVHLFRRLKGQLAILFDLDADGRWHDAGLGRRRARTAIPRATASAAQPGSPV